MPPSSDDRLEALEQAEEGEEGEEGEEEEELDELAYILAVKGRPVETATSRGRDAISWLVGES